MIPAAFATVSSTVVVVNRRKAAFSQPRTAVPPSDRPAMPGEGMNLAPITVGLLAVPRKTSRSCSRRRPKSGGAQ